MLVFPNAKINIGLRILSKLPDGFHTIETIFYPIRFCDALEFVEIREAIPEDYRFSVSGITFDNCASENNLCIRAYRLLANDHALPKLNIHLHKIIPMGAGLGGGSSDAARMVKALNETYKLNLSYAAMQEYVEKLGSDCAFFIGNKPAYATGKGNVLSRINLSLWGYYLALVYPGIHIGTAEAYANATLSNPDKPLTELIKEPVEEWKHCIINDFENSIFPKYPEIKAIKEKLYELGAVYASMSGSGSSVYGIFNDSIPVKQHFESYLTWECKL
ncbi:MAG: 4-(cytidine 5'-diphospho)-2-C-methyl-D-erythritol kinase [Bacteroidia bacterium]|nr:4-(cytidine 5'-diphospho)-2-C-methyl-D-erythritol kinase [Bacteroidia bacterium]